MEFRQARYLSLAQRTRPASATALVPHTCGGAVRITVCIEGAAAIHEDTHPLGCESGRARSAVYVLAAISVGKFQFVRESREPNEDRWLKY